MNDSDFPYRLHGFGSLCGPSGLPLTRELVEDMIVGLPVRLDDMMPEDEILLEGPLGSVRIVNVG